MKAIKKTSDNLKSVVDSITGVHFSKGSFTLDYLSTNCAALSSVGRDSFGVTVIKLIPSNYIWRVSFASGTLRLFIWF